MITYGSFIAFFPEFSNATTFPSGQITTWIPVAYAELNAYRFWTQIDIAASLFVAHNIVLSAQAAQIANAGGIVGEASGPVQSKAVGPVSVGYNTTATIIEGAGPWNATSYGQRLYKMMQAYCSGPVYSRRRGYRWGGLSPWTYPWA
jgi:hypothetical protein